MATTALQGTSTSTPASPCCLACTCFTAHTAHTMSTVSAAARPMPCRRNAQQRSQAPTRHARMCTAQRIGALGRADGAAGAPAQCKSAARKPQRRAPKARRGCRPRARSARAAQGGQSLSTLLSEWCSAALTRQQCAMTATLSALVSRLQQVGLQAESRLPSIGQTFHLQKEAKAVEPAISCRSDS